MDYIQLDGLVIGINAGYLIFLNNLSGNLRLINTTLDVHCPEGKKRGMVDYPLKDNLRLTNTCALVVRKFPDGLELRLLVNNLILFGMQSFPILLVTSLIAIPDFFDFLSFSSISCAQMCFSIT